MKATNLPEVVRYFNQNRPLRGEQLDTWFVERQQLLRRNLMNMLRYQEDTDCPKILFAGQRGNGKSTELNKLAQELQDVFHVVNFSIRIMPGLVDMEYEDLMVAMYTQMITYCIDHALLHPSPGQHMQQGLEKVYDWWRKNVSGLSIPDAPSEGEIQAKLSFLIAEIMVKMQHSPDDRKLLRDQIHEQMTRLIKDMNWIVRKAEQATGKRLLIIVEDLDKVDPKAAADIFYGHAATLQQPEVTIIYTFPVTLRYSEHYGAICTNFSEDNIYMLHNIRSHQQNEEPDSQGIAALCAIVRKRLEEHLIDDEILRGIAFYSAGNPSSLVSLVRSAALYALSRDSQATCITQEDANNAFKDLRENLSVLLNERDIEVLCERHQDHELTNDADDQQVLYKRALVEYRDEQSGQPWCDAHPLLWNRLRQAERDRDAPPTEDPA